MKSSSSEPQDGPSFEDAARSRTGCLERPIDGDVDRAALAGAARGTDEGAMDRGDFLGCQCERASPDRAGLDAVGRMQRPAGDRNCRVIIDPRRPVPIGIRQIAGSCDTEKIAERV